MPFIKVYSPECEYIETAEIEITAVHEDGSFNYIGKIVTGYHARDTVYDDTGQTMAPVVTPTVEQRLAELLVLMEGVVI